MSMLSFTYGASSLEISTSLSRAWESLLKVSFVFKISLRLRLKTFPDSASTLYDLGSCSLATTVPFLSQNFLG